jgi:uncharacterized membrane protein
VRQVCNLPNNAWQVQNLSNYIGGMSSPAAARLPLAVLFVLVLLGAALRVWRARESLWLDELHTAWCALGPLPDVVQRATIGNQSPLFFWLEWLLVQILGAGEPAVRLPSLVAGSILPVALYWLTDRWTRQPWLGVLAAWLVVVDPIQIYYATEARPYALVELIAVAHVGLLADLLVRPRPALHVAFILLGALLFHLHYTAGLLFPAEFVAVALIVLLTRNRQATAPEAQSSSASAKLLFRDGLAIAALCLPAIPNLLAIFARRTNWELFVHKPTLETIVTLIPWSWTAAVVLAGLAYRFSRRTLDPDDDIPSVFSLCWLLVPLLLALLLTITDTARLFFLRYLMVSAPAAIILAALAVRLIPWRSIQITAALSVAIFAMLGPVIPLLATDTTRHADWRSAIAHFNQQPDHDRYPVVLATQLIESDALRGSSDPALVAYCLFPVHSLYPIAADPRVTFPLPLTNPGQLSPRLVDLVRSRGGVWLIVAGREDAADVPADQIVGSVQSPRSNAQGRQEDWSVVDRHSFGTIHIMLIRTSNLEP